MQFEVRGADATTGQDLVKTIEADSASEAEEIAREEGMFVSRVKAISRVAGQSTIATRPQVQAHAVAAMPYTPTVMVKPDKIRGVSGFGVASLVIAILAILVCWIPLVGMLCIPLAVIAMILGVVGAIISLVGGRSGVGLPVAGAVIAGLAAFLAFSISAAVVGGVAKSIERANQTRKNMEVAQSSPSTAPSTADMPVASSVRPAYAGGKNGTGDQVVAKLPRFTVGGLHIGDVVSKEWMYSRCASIEGDNPVSGHERVEIGDHTIYVYYKLKDRRLIGVKMTYDTSVYPDVVEFYRQKFGTGPRLESETMRTKMGVQVENEMSVWDTDSGQMVVCKYGSSIDKGVAFLDNKESKQASEDEKSKQIESLKSKL